MDNSLIIFILIAVVLHLAEYFSAKCKRIFSVVNILFHILIFGLFIISGLDLTALFTFLLSSILVMLIIRVKEERNGI